MIGGVFRFSVPNFGFRPGAARTQWSPADTPSDNLQARGGIIDIARRHKHLWRVVGRTELCEFRRSLNTMPELTELGPAYRIRATSKSATRKRLRLPFARRSTPQVDQPLEVLPVLTTGVSRRKLLQALGINPILSESDFLGA